MEKIETCNNCGMTITCSCEYKTASDGVEVCENCLQDYEIFTQYVNNMRNYVNENNLQDDHCVIFYVFTGDNNPTNRQIYHIYKNVDHFELKGRQHIKSVDPSLGIDFQLWMYD